MAEAAQASLGAQPDESGIADLVCEKGAILLAPDPAGFKDAFKKAKKMKGYRWIMINEADLFKANTLSISSRAGMITPEGKVLKNSRV
jgi:hypothetical protein